MLLRYYTRSCCVCVELFAFVRGGGKGYALTFQGVFENYEWEKSVVPLLHRVYVLSSLHLFVEGVRGMRYQDLVLSTTLGLSASLLSVYVCVWEGQESGFLYPDAVPLLHQV